MMEPRLDLPLHFHPIPVERVWGGNRLPALFGRPATPHAVIGESWELVDRPETQSILANGAAIPRTLGELLRQDPRRLIGQPLAARALPRFPVLVKYIDAGTALSVQVHPDDAGARAYNDCGKAECWVVVHAEPGARIVRGLKSGVTRAAYQKAVAADRIEDVLHSFTPRVGDCIALPAGMVHALGAGLVVAEIQQNSDVTFRIHDYKRLGLDGKPRQLHAAEALGAIRFESAGDDFEGDMSADVVVPLQRPAGNGILEEHLLRGRHFDLTRFVLAAGSATTIEACPDAARVLMAIAGRGTIGGGPLHAGATLLLPAAMAAMGLAAGDEGLTVLISRVG
jgi:mannose-6-phosphate isomerase